MEHRHEQGRVRQDHGRRGAFAPAGIEILGQAAELGVQVVAGKKADGRAVATPFAPGRGAGLWCKLACGAPVRHPLPVAPAGPVLAALLEDARVAVQAHAGACLPERLENGVLGAGEGVETGNKDRTLRCRLEGFGNAPVKNLRHLKAHEGLSGEMAFG